MAIKEFTIIGQDGTDKGKTFHVTVNEDETITVSSGGNYTLAENDNLFRLSLNDIEYYIIGPLQELYGFEDGDDLC